MLPVGDLAEGGLIRVEPEHPGDPLRGRELRLVQAEGMADRQRGIERRHGVVVVVGRLRVVVGRKRGRERERDEDGLDQLPSPAGEVRR